jgi:hypothetical protein
MRTQGRRWSPNYERERKCARIARGTRNGVDIMKATQLLHNLVEDRRI